MVFAVAESAASGATGETALGSVAGLVGFVFGTGLAAGWESAGSGDGAVGGVRSCETSAAGLLAGASAVVSVGGSGKEDLDEGMESMCFGREIWIHLDQFRGAAANRRRAE